ncbi:MAG: hypothetical protein K2L42_01110 [Clostridia bacterium]|nr:hypothetical protein [Clostridia bacterium]
MKKFFKNVLAVCSVLSLTATMGFAAACDPEPEPEPEGHTHNYTEWRSDDSQHWKKCPDDGAISEKSDHEYVEGVCECGDCGTNAAINNFNLGTADLDVVGETKAVFFSGVGTYKLKVNNVKAGRSYTFKIGSEEFTVDSTHKEFTFNVLGESVSIYSPASADASSKWKTVTGVIIKVVPAEDYSTATEKDSLSLTVEEVSKRLSSGQNTLTVGGTVINSYSTSKYGEHKFIFDISNDDEYTVEVCGVTKTVNKTNNEFTVDIQKEKEDLFQRDVSLFSVKFTSAASNAATPAEFGMYILQPKTVGSYSYGELFGVSSAKYPEIIDYYNGEYDFNVTNRYNNQTEKWAIEAGETYAFSGTVYYSDFEVYVGEDKVGEFTGVDSKSDEATEFTVSFELKPEHFNEDKSVTFTFKFLGEEKFTVLAKFGMPPQEVDNHILHLNNKTECLEKDAAEDGTYTYTFTAPQDGWYLFEMYGSTGVKYTVGADKTGTLSISSTTKVVVQLAKDQEMTVVLEDGIGKEWDWDLGGFKEVPVNPVGTSIQVTETEEPAALSSILGVYDLSSNASGAVEHVVSVSGWYEFKTDYSDGFGDVYLNGEEGCSSWEMVNGYGHYKVYLEAGQKFKVTGFEGGNGYTYTITSIHNLFSSAAKADEHVVTEDGWYEFKTNYSDGFGDVYLNGEEGCSSWEMVNGYGHYKVYLEAGQKFKVTGFELSASDNGTYTYTFAKM